MPGYTDKSRQYLRLAAENDRRAANTDNAQLKALFSTIAVQYRDLALQIDDPERSRAEMIASTETKRK
jgi:hypothetical protein